MKAYQIQTAAGIDAIELVDLPEPQPSAGQILVRVRATSLNYRDTAVASGQYPGQTLPIIPLSDGAGDVNHTQILMKAIDVQGIYVGSREMFETMNRAIAFHQIQPVIDRVFPFAEAPAAYRHLQSGSHFGKVVIQV